MISTSAGRAGASVVACLVAQAIASAESITLEQSMALAEATHPRLRAGQARTAAAAGDILTARARPNPQVAAMTGYQYSQPPGGRRYNTSLFTLSQPLELGPLRAARLDFAERGVESSQLDERGVRLSVLSNVRRMFFEVLRRDNEISIVQQSLRLAQDLRDRIRVRVDVGEVGRLELVRAEAEVATARSVVANARASRIGALAAFHAAIGSVHSSVEPSGALPASAVLPPLETLREQVLNQHPALAFSEAEIRRAGARLTYERALKRPQPAVLAEVDQTNPSYRFGIAIDLPLFNKRRGQIAVAEANIREQRYLAEARRVELMALLESAYERYQVSTQEVAALEEGLMREAQEAVRAAEVAYQLGERSVIDVLDAQRVLRTVRLNLSNAQFDRQAAAIEIDELRGVVGETRP